MKAQSETAIVRQILEYLKLRRIVAWRNNNGGVFDPTRKRFRSFQGMRGASDILGLLEPSGRMLAIEAKTKTGKLSEDQKAFIDMINRAGGIAFVARSIRDVQLFLTAAGV